MEELRAYISLTKIGFFCIEDQILLLNELIWVLGISFTTEELRYGISSDKIGCFVLNTIIIIILRTDAASCYFFYIGGTQA